MVSPSESSVGFSSAVSPVGFVDCTQRHVVNISWRPSPKDLLIIVDRTHSQPEPFYCLINGVIASVAPYGFCQLGVLEREYSILTDFRFSDKWRYQHLGLPIIYVGWWERISLVRFRSDSNLFHVFQHRVSEDVLGQHIRRVLLSRNFGQCEIPFS